MFCYLPNKFLNNKCNIFRTCKKRPNEPETVEGMRSDCLAVEEKGELELVQAGNLKGQGTRLDTGRRYKVLIV